MGRRHTFPPGRAIMSPPYSRRKPYGALRRVPPEILRRSLRVLFLAGGTTVLVTLVLLWLPTGRWHAELFAAGALVALLSPVLGVVLDASRSASEGDRES